MSIIKEWKVGKITGDFQVWNPIYFFELSFRWLNMTEKRDKVNLKAIVVGFGFGCVSIEWGD